MDKQDAPQPNVAPDAARKDAATSSDTLDDIEQETKVGDTGTSTGDDANDSNDVPAPDGTPDPARGDNSDSRATGEPM